jgi:diguanylate cyclase (GGDEF)-like protein/PAS domain S-box-containing protein
LKQWQESLLGTDGERLADMMRFNEAIDQSVQSAVVAYTAEKERRIRLLEQMLSSMPDHSCIFDLEGRFIYVNQSLAEQIGKSSHEILGKNLFDLGIASAEVLHRQIEGVIYSKQPHRAETSGKSSELQPRYFEYILAPVVDPQGRVEAVTGTARDITERKMLDVEIWHKANYDALTGLPNRRLFRDRFEHEIKHAERTGMPLALMFIDLDRFKEINDTLGHEAGDLLLKQAGERLQACVREADTVARLGGDEFTVILADTSDGEHIRVVAEKILWELDRPFPLTQKSAHVSGSIGITLFPEDADTPTDLLRHADQAMYAAKNAGRGRYCFFSESTHR